MAGPPFIVISGSAETTMFSVKTPDESAVPVPYALPSAATVTAAFGAKRQVTLYENELPASTTTDTEQVVFGMVGVVSVAAPAETTDVVVRRNVSGRTAAVPI